MKLREVLQGVPVVRLSGSDEGEVKSVVYSSLQVTPGSLFAALRGEKRDGLDFAEEAWRKGAAAVLADRPKPAKFRGIWVEVPDSREALALAAANFFGHPSRGLTVVGVTGTKGKTTVTHLLESILQAAGFRTGLIGTISYRGPGFSAEAERTTPEAPDIQGLLRRMAEAGASHCLLEVSSHALDLKRVWAVEFDVAVFTNLSGEHLDYHGSMEDYFAAKKKLFFLNSKKRTAVVNTDDTYGRRLLEELPLKTISFGCDPAAIVRAADYSSGRDGLQVTADYPGGRAEIRSPLMGRHNLYNILAALASGLALNVPLSGISEGIARLSAIPGRMERVANEDGLLVFVDYAHTDSALRSLLETARGLRPNRIILVFGAGGDRDRTKRERMGAVAAELADRTFLTSDNPRSEDPAAILAEIEKGFQKKGSRNFTSLVDRREAIARALALARKGDLVLVAGKGHEGYQIIKDRRLPFNDAEVIRKILAQRKKVNRG